MDNKYLRLVLDIDVELNGVPLEQISQNLQKIVNTANGDGWITGSSDAELNGLSHIVVEINEEDYGATKWMNLPTPRPSQSQDAGTAGSVDRLISSVSSSSEPVSNPDSTAAEIVTSVERLSEPSEKPSGLRVSASMHSDDYAYEHEFDASPWMKTATLKELAALSKCGWGGNDAADAVALELEDTDENIETILEYCRGKTECGFEVYVDETQAKRWLLEHRPEDLKKLLDWEVEQDGLPPTEIQE